MAAATPILKAMGKQIWHCGGAGAGHAAKVMPQLVHLGATWCTPTSFKQASAAGLYLG